MHRPAQQIPASLKATPVGVLHPRPPSRPPHASVPRTPTPFTALLPIGSAGRGPRRPPSARCLLLPTAAEDPSMPCKPLDPRAAFRCSRTGSHFRCRKTCAQCIKGGLRPPPAGPTVGALQQKRQEQLKWWRRQPDSWRAGLHSERDVTCFWRLGGHFSMWKKMRRAPDLLDAALSSQAVPAPPAWREQSKIRSAKGSMDPAAASPYLCCICAVCQPDPGSKRP